MRFQVRIHICPLFQIYYQIQSYSHLLTAHVRLGAIQGVHSHAAEHAHVVPAEKLSIDDFGVKCYFAPETRIKTFVICPCCIHGRHNDKTCTKKNF